MSSTEEFSFQSTTDAFELIINSLQKQQLLNCSHDSTPLIYLRLAESKGRAHLLYPYRHGQTLGRHILYQRVSTYATCRGIFDERNCRKSFRITVSTHRFEHANYEICFQARYAQGLIAFFPISWFEFELSVQERVSRGRYVYPPEKTDKIRFRTDVRAIYVFIKIIRSIIEYQAA